MIETVMLQTIMAVALWCQPQGQSVVLGNQYYSVVGSTERACREQLLACLTKTNDTQERLACFQKEKR